MPQQVTTGWRMQGMAADLSGRPFCSRPWRSNCHGGETSQTELEDNTRCGDACPAGIFRALDFPADSCAACPLPKSRPR